jgi:iron complex transport system permease protein
VTGRHIKATYLALLGLLAVVVGLAIALGQSRLGDPALTRTLVGLRATRVGAAFLAGAGLAMGGAVVQGLFRNPLVSPEILGTSAGAILAGQIALLVLAVLVPRGAIGPVGAEMVLPAGCLVGAAVSLVVVLAFLRGRTGTLLLLLTGFVLNSLFLSVGGFATSLAQDSWDLGRAVVAFTLGGVGGVSARLVLAATPLVIAGGLAVWWWGRTLDLMLSGEEEAASLGVEVNTTRRWIIVWVAVMTAAAVAVGGSVGFVGVIIPHALRPFVGVKHRVLIPASAILGGTFLVGCDLLARVVPSRAEIPLGVITGLIGAPIFLFLLSRTRLGAIDD